MAITKLKLMERMTESSSALSGAGTYYSDVGMWEVSAVESEKIVGEVYNFGNTDNYLKFTVMWGWARDGEWPFEHATPASSSMLWKEDQGLVTYVFCGSTTSEKVPVVIDLPEMKAMFRKLKVELFGTAPTANIRLNCLQDLG